MRRILSTAVAGLVVLCLPLAALAGNWISGSYTNSYGTRDYELYIPTGYTAGTRTPLLVGLHGCTENAAQFAGLTRIAALADTHGLLVILPSQSPLANQNFCWNWFEPAHQKRDQGEPSIISGMVDFVKDNYTVDDSRVYVFGLSAGGFMTSTMLSCYSDVFAAGMISAGGMYEPASDLPSALAAQSGGSANDPNVSALHAWQCSGSVHPRPLPLLVFHGSNDGTVNPINAQQAVDQFAQTNDYGDDGVDNDSFTNVPSETGSAVSAGGLTYRWKDYLRQGTKLLSFYLVEGMSHRWSGGDQLYVWGEPRGPDATAMMWDFFQLQRRGIGLTSIEPPSLCQGSPETALVLSGADFAAGAIVQVNGSNRAADVVNSRRLNVILTSDDLLLSGRLNIRVVLGDRVSNDVAFTVTADTMAPQVTPPAALEVMQSTCAGTSDGHNAPALAAFLTGGTAADDCSTATTRLAPQVNGSDATLDTAFPAGTTPVTFRFRDNAGNIASASSSVTIRLWGDLDLDDQTDASDLVIFANYLAGNVTPGSAPFRAPASANDLNRDGTTDAVDFVIEANFLVGNVSCLLPPS